MSTKKKRKAIRNSNTLDPIETANSRALILGTFPGPKSLKAGAYYSNPTNRFRKVVAGVYKEMEPKTKEEFKAFLDGHRIALWDVCESCKIEGAADSSICEEKPNDIKRFLDEHKQIEKIACNGSKARKLFRKYFRDLEKNKDIEVKYLPSTSGANTRYKTDRLIEKYKVIL